MKFKLKKEFDEWVDEQGDIDVCGVLYSPSKLLELVDPIRYYHAYLEYLDENGLEEEDDAI